MTVPNDRLDPSLEALLKSERAAPDPLPEVQERVWLSVQEGIAVATAAPAVAAAASPSKVAGVAWSKWFAVSLVVVTGASAAYVASRQEQAPSKDRIAAEQLADEPPSSAADNAPDEVAHSVGGGAVETTAATTESPQAVAKEVPEEAAPTAVEIKIKDSAEITTAALGAVRERKVKRRPKNRTRAAAADAKPTSAAAPVGGSMQAELKLLSAARKALIDGEVADALASITRHGEVYPDGQLAEERSALKVQTLAANGDMKGAQAAAKEFADRYPQSLMLPAVRRAAGVQAQ